LIQVYIWTHSNHFLSIESFKYIFIIAFVLFIVVICVCTLDIKNGLNLLVSLLTFSFELFIFVHCVLHFKFYLVREWVVWNLAYARYLSYFTESRSIDPFWRTNHCAAFYIYFLDFNNWLRFIFLSQSSYRFWFIVLDIYFGCIMTRNASQLSFWTRWRYGEFLFNIKLRFFRIFRCMNLFNHRLDLLNFLIILHFLLISIIFTSSVLQLNKICIFVTFLRHWFTQSILSLEFVNYFCNNFSLVLF
jgi:hypothetical protein